MKLRVHAVSRWVLAIALVVSTLSLYASNQVLDEDNFAQLFSSSVAEPEVRNLLATAAIDVALDASNADAQLADALPDNLALIATPAIELTKPTVAEAGAALLGVDAVGASLDTAARSVHRQAVSSVLATEEQDVVVSSLPVLVVVADQIGGDAMARAIVGLDLPESATSINLGSNQSVAWGSVSGVAAVGAVASLIVLVSMIVYFATAPKGTRLAALRRLGRTYIRAGLVIMLVAWIVIVVGGTVIGALLAPDEPLTFSTITIGGSGVADGAFDLATVLLSPLASAARRLVVTGAIMIVAGHLLGPGAIAVGLRESIRGRSLSPLLGSLATTLPDHRRRTTFGIWAALIVGLLGWPGLTLRVALTMTAIAIGAIAILGALSTSDPRWAEIRTQLRLPTVANKDATGASKRAAAHRRWIATIAVVAAVFWPSYTVRGFMWLMLLIAVPMAWTYQRELAPPSDEMADLAVAESGRWSTTTRLVAFGVVALIGLIWLSSADSIPDVAATTVSGQEPTTCNGFAELCDTPFDEVAFAGTHNSMSASELGWELANHGGAIPKQLDGGIRALLIDVQKWEAAANLDEFASDPAALEIAQQALAVADAPEDGLWMCHSLCQLGGTPFEEFLATLRAFMLANPNEVVVVVIQDEASAKQIKAAIERARLVELAFAHDPGTPWPTLGEMIAADTRVVFMAENEADETGWYQPAFDGNVIETDFSYAVIEDFECAANRGGDEGSLFMINHWVETGLPVPAEADRVNSRAVLNERVAECQRTRGRMPGIIAVNFWERGDLLAVVNELNGVAAS